MIREKRSAGKRILLTGLLIGMLGLSACGKESVIYQISDSESVLSASGMKDSSAGSRDTESKDAAGRGENAAGATGSDGTAGSGSADGTAGTEDTSGAEATADTGNTADAGAAGTAADGEADEAAGKDAGPLYVYVCGAVERPGVYELPQGSRVYQAIEAAGGLTQDAEGKCLNQAEPLEDGSQITVYTREEAEKFSLTDPSAVKSQNTGTGGETAVSGSPSGNEDAGAQETSKVNLNTATKEELMTLPGIGESRADDIIAYRQTSGGFSSIEDIQNISGIKEKAFAKIRDYIEV